MPVTTKINDIDLHDFTNGDKPTDADFDKNPQIFKDKINSVVDDLTTLETDKASVTYVDSTVQGVVLGQVPDNTWTEDKMANDMKKDIAGGIVAHDTYTAGMAELADDMKIVFQEPYVFSNRLYFSEISYKKLYEIDVNTLANLSGSGILYPGTNSSGIGGISNKLYNCSDALDKVYELDPDTLANLSGVGVSSPGSNSSGIGGIYNRLYLCDFLLDKIYELDINTLANLSGAGVSDPSGYSTGIGGIYNRLYLCDSLADKVYELDPDTLANLSGVGVSSPGSNIWGVGGISNRLYCCDSNIPYKLYELDINTLANLSGSGVAPPGSGTAGIGGLSSNYQILRINKVKYNDIIYDLENPIDIIK